MRVTCQWTGAFLGNSSVAGNVEPGSLPDGGRGGRGWTVEKGGQSGDGDARVSGPVTSAVGDRQGGRGRRGGCAEARSPVRRTAASRSSQSGAATACITTRTASALVAHRSTPQAAERRVSSRRSSMQAGSRACRTMASRAQAVVALRQVRRMARLRSKSRSRAGIAFAAELALLRGTLAPFGNHCGEIHVVFPTSCWGN